MTFMSDSRNAKMQQLTDSFVARLRRGESPPIEDYKRRYPDLATEIDDVFPALEMLEQCRPNRDEERQMSNVDDAIPDWIGEYRIIQEIGRGGMGVVYEAEHATMSRRVALKVLPKNSATDAAKLARFRREAREAGRLHHSNIVPVFEVGYCDGLHFYAMQFIRGQNLDLVIEELKRLRRESDANHVDHVTDASQSDQLSRTIAANLYNRTSPDNGTAGEKKAKGHGPSGQRAQCDRTVHPSDQNSSEILLGSSDRSSTTNSRRQYYRRVAEIGVQIADALRYAHQCAVLHRDVKPANLILDTDGKVWILDFGLAKGEEDGLTHTGDILGTVRYMAPERFQGDADGRSDIYSLGLTLYELCTLNYAFEGTDHASLLKQITSFAPRSPRQIESAIPRDLETIVLKAIDPDPDRRYQKPNDLGEDLKLFLMDHPIRARRISTNERLWRWCKRNRVTAGLLAATSLLVMAFAVAGPLVATYQASQAERYRRLLYTSELNVASRAWEDADVERVNSLLERHVPRAGQKDLRGFEWYCLWECCRKGRESPTFVHDSTVRAIAYCMDGELLAIAVGDTIVIRNAATGTIRHKLQGHTDMVGALAVTRCGTRLASASWDKTVRVWDVPSGTAIGDPFVHQGRVFGVAFSGNDRLLATCSEDPSVRVWRLDDNSLVTSTREPAYCAAFFHDDRKLALGCRNGSLKIWDFHDGSKPISLPTVHEERIWQMKVSSDGETLAACGWDNRITLWDTERVRLRCALPNHTRRIMGISFSPDGTTLASVSWDNTVRLWDTTSGHETNVLKGHSKALYAVAYSPDGKFISSGGADRFVKIWDIRKPVRTRLTGHKGLVRRVAFSRDGALVSSSFDGTVRLWEDEATSSRVFEGHSGAIWGATFSPDGRSIVSSGEDYTIRVWDLSTGRSRIIRGHEAWVWDVIFSPSGKLLVSCDGSGLIKIWDAENAYKERGTFKAHSSGTTCLAFAPNGQWMLSCGRDESAKVWRTSTLGTSSQPVKILSGHNALVWAVAVAPDGIFVATGGSDNSIRIWQSSDWSEKATLTGHSATVWSVAFSPNDAGRTLASASDDGTVKIWNCETGDERGTLYGHARSVYGVAFSPDGLTLASCSQDETIRLWRRAPKAKAVQFATKIGQLQP